MGLAPAWVSIRHEYRKEAGMSRLEQCGPLEFDAASDITLLQWLDGMGRHPNTLIICPEEAVAAVLRQVKRRSVQPVHYRILPGALPLPSQGGGTLVLNDAGTMTLRQQIMLFDWMNSIGRHMQVISLTRRCPHAMVRNGEFLEGLLYRLNVVRLELKAA
jgi:hypothetical protein